MPLGRNVSLGQVAELPLHSSARSHPPAAAAREQAAEASSFAAGFSLAAGGEASHVSPETARLAMQTLRQNPNLKDLADLLGWARQLVREVWRTSPRARSSAMCCSTSTARSR